MKRVVSFALALILLLTAFVAAEAAVWFCPTCERVNAGRFCEYCGEPRPEDIGNKPEVCDHKIVPATCVSPKMCELCGEEFGQALGHVFVPATYTAPMYCSRCLKTVGTPLTPTPTPTTKVTPTPMVTVTPTSKVTATPLMTHNWVAATCDSPKTCSVCGKTEGAALGHNWAAATCTSPRTCIRCNKTTGDALGHSWTAATCDSPKTCTRCGKTEGAALGHNWAPATYTAPETCQRCGETRGERLKEKTNSEKAKDLSGSLLFGMMIDTVSIGDSVFFGAYEQDGNAKNGAEPIEWVVLDEKNGSYLLISYYVLDAMQFHSTCTAVKWSQSSLRKWLNGEFYDNAFTADEKALIKTNNVYTPVNPYYRDVWNGFTSNDNVFLLSIDEAIQYFNSDYDRVGFPTEKAIQDGILLNNDYSVWWWLRTPGNRDYAAAGVYGDGSVYEIGDDVDCSINGVRPVIWIDLNASAPEPQKHSIEVGQTYYFGSYEQNGYHADGAEEIAWRVLDIQNDKALLLSEYILDAYFYNNLANAVTWEDCTLRVWLNNNFYSIAFDNSEKQRIVQTKLSADSNPTNTFASAGNSTQDRVFILSASDINKYLTSNYERAGYGTEYAFDNGLYKNDKLGSTWWWVRTPGKSNKWAVRVLSTGEIVYDGTSVNSDNGGVRPAIWITVD